MRFASSSNFRHVGEARGPGLPLRHLYRSDHLGALDAHDAAQIRALGITRVLDFRGVHERTSAACRLEGVTVHSLPIEPTIVQKLSELVASGHALTGADVTAHMQDTYRGFVRDSTPRFAEFFHHLLASDEPTVFHCTAGKDRTGFAAALLLKAVGASDAAVMHDYLLTNDRVRLPDASSMGLPREAMEVLWRVHPEFLQAAFDEVDAAYGSLEQYFAEGLALREPERARLRHLYLHAGPR
ncbi:tyrosine-protein phosphatase [Ramlibacter ginsenosidimutans]|uniref:Tyrosine-protein phosphatase n=1 Tax=Ramlibacter ginsenosidimutans TaxID=502333 RepID=A0A934TSM6_9BURK|nr:tyrosine-protein phosphatase [Ramlibacter ginsenosidimutans]MBK6006792.1 tyrosine-protein phosphatase [Ramlibacter ginsenosidimutans]